MFKLLSILCGKIDFELETKKATLDVNHISNFHYEDKIYILDHELSTEVELFWRNKSSLFALSAALSDDFRQVYLVGYYRDELTTSKIKMIDNYILSRDDYDTIHEIFLNILEHQYVEKQRIKDKQNLALKGGLSLLTGATMYAVAGTVFGFVGLIAIPLLLNRNSNVKSKNKEIILNFLKRNQTKTIKQLSELV